MKKTTITTLLLLLFCLNISAEDGNMPTGNKSCTQNCLASNTDSSNTENKKDADSLYEYLKNLFSNIL